MIRHLLLAASLTAALVSPALAETYRIDPGHTQVRFGYSHFGFSNIEGILSGIEGELVHDPETPEKSAVSVRIPLSSLHTGTAKLDEHLKAADFFEIAKYPVATFTSRSVEPKGEGRLAVTGDLSLHGVTKPVTLDVTLNKLGPHPMSGKPTIGFDATAQIRRSEYGIEKYAPNVSDEVTLEITVEAQADKPQ